MINLAKLTILVAAALGIAAQSQKPWPTFPGLEGPYLGQAPPGAKAALFARGIVSTGMTERGVAVTRDGLEMFFEQSAGRVVTIMTTRFEGGRWTEPAVASFASDLRFYHRSHHSRSVSDSCGVSRGRASAASSSRQCTC